MTWTAASWTIQACWTARDRCAAQHIPQRGLNAARDCPLD